MTSYDLPTIPRADAESLERIAFLDASIQALSGIHEVLCGLFPKHPAQILLVSHVLTLLSTTIATLRGLRDLVDKEV